MFFKISHYRPFSHLAPFLLLFISLPGCQRFYVETQSTAKAKGAEELSVTVRTFQKHKHQKEKKPLKDGVVTSLLYLKNGNWQTIGRSAKGEWSLKNLVPGAYKIAVAGILNEAGQMEPMKGPLTRQFELHEGRFANIDIVVQRMSTGTKILIGVTIVAVIWLIILAIFKDDFDVDLGDIVRPVFTIPRLILNYPDIWVEIILNSPPSYPPIGYDPTLDEDEENDDEDSDYHNHPHISSYFPAHDATSVAKDADIWLEFNMPMSDWTLSPNTIYVQGSQSGEMVRGVLYQPEQHRVLVDPIRDFAPGETIKVLVYGEGIATPEGETLPKNYQFSFQVATP